MNLAVTILALAVSCVSTYGQAIYEGLTAEELELFESFGITVTDASDTQWLLEHVGIPDHETGDFPNNGNPNSIAEQNHDYYIPKSPTWLETPGCLSLGIIAMSKSGVPFFNPYTATGLNAIENEEFDDCEGHPDAMSTYHYHQLPTCLYEGGNNEVMGVALDGYLIVGPKDENGVELTTDDLDFCHGRWYNGRYQYHITRDFPYVMSCYRGEATSAGGPTNTGRKRRHAIESNQRLKRQRPPPGGGPPPPMFDACYAYCENPGSDTECMEPMYSSSNDTMPEVTRAEDMFVSVTQSQMTSDSDVTVAQTEEPTTVSGATRIVFNIEFIICIVILLHII